MKGTDIKFSIHFNQAQIEAFHDLITGFGVPEMSITWTDEQGEKQSKAITAADLETLTKFSELT